MLFNLIAEWERFLLFEQWARPKGCAQKGYAMKRVSQNPFSLLLLLAFFALLGCGVDATKDDDPMVGSIVHRDFPCIMGGTVGPVTDRKSVV